MAFKTLEQRFNETSKEIYNRFQPSRDQLVSIKPDTRGNFGASSRIKDDTRALPVTSFIRDTKRITNFLKSSEGLLYIGKQVLLQTGNTFEESRIYNPLSNYQIPNLLRIKRIIGGDDNTKGILQPDTISQFTGTKDAPRVTESVLVKFNYNETPGRPEINVFGPNYSPFLRKQQPLEQRSQKKSNVLNSSGLSFDVNNKAFDFGREFTLRAVSYPGSELTSTQVERNDRLKKKFDNLFAKFGTTNKVSTDFYFGGNTRGYQATLNVDSGLFEEAAPRTSNTDGLVNSPGDYLKPYDPINVTNVTKTFGKLDNGINKIDYEKIVQDTAETDSANPDIINFTFQVAGTPPGQTQQASTATEYPIIKFRAFISTFKQTVKPEFAEQKYLGRTERFVSYSGVKRTASLSFNVVAFSKIELDTVWTKINYLTGLAFPLGVSKSGFLVPPLFKISIGNIYDAQPCYIENLDFDFIDKDITFDIDNEVSQFVNVNMSIVLLEKRSRFYNSPFYQITEDLAKQV